MIRAHQPGAEPVYIPEAIPNPAVVPQTQPAPIKPSPRREPVKPPEKAPANAIFYTGSLSVPRRFGHRRSSLRPGMTPITPHETMRCDHSRRVGLRHRPC